MSARAWTASALAVWLTVAGSAARAAPAAEPGAVRAYRLLAAVEAEQGRITGTMRLGYRHDGACPVGTLAFLLVPNRFASPPDLPYERLDPIYPLGFTPATLGVREVAGPNGEPLPFTVEGTRLTVALPAPLAPGASTSISLAFETTLPVAQGLFARLEGVLRVQGGWHPLLAAFDDGTCTWRTDRLPGLSTFDATIAAAPDVTVVSAGSREPVRSTGAGLATRFVAEGRYLPLVASPRYAFLARESGRIRVEAAVFRRAGGRADRLLEVAVRAAAAFEARHGPLGRPVEIRFAEVPHAFGVAAYAEGVIFFDPRLGRLLAWLRPFHDRQVAYRVFESLWRLHLAERGVTPPPWTLEALAAIETRATEETIGARPPGFEAFIKRFGFIPLVDEFLYSGRVADRAIFQEAFVAIEDPTDLARLDAPRLGGARIVQKLEALVGAEALVAAAVAYGRAPGAADFVSVLSATSGRDLAPFVREWTVAPRAADYGVDTSGSRVVAREPRTYETPIRVHARVAKTAPAAGLVGVVPVREAVPVAITFRGGEETETVLVSPVEAAITLRSERPVRVVEVDPGLVTEDPWRADNREPPRWRVLLREFSVSFDIRGGDLRATAGLSAQRGRGPTFGLRGFTDQTSTGVEASATFALDEWAEGVRQGLSVGLTGERLDRSFGPGVDDARWISELTAGYELDSRRDLRNPLSGATAGLTLRVSDGVLGSDAEYVIARARTTRYIRVGPNQALAFRAEVGETLDGRPPFGKGLLLGGFDGLRAYPQDAFSGRSLSLGSVEYRTPLVRDLDQWVAGLVGFGGLSAAVGVEAGQASPDRNPFRPSDYKTGVTLGFRFAVRIFGVSPVLWSLDAAMPLAGGPQPDETRVYISASQSF